MGADDYITKPFRARELVARINKVIRNKKVNNILNIKNITINTNLAKVYKNNEKIYLSSTEYKILLYLVENKNKVLSREKILQFIWDSNMEFVNDNTLTVYIKRLRNKIESDNESIIRTVRGIGYIIEENL